MDTTNRSSENEMMDVECTEMLVKRMEEDLNRLLDSCPKSERKNYEEDNDHFFKMFQNFLSTTEQPILWDHIEPYPLLLHFLSPVEEQKINVLLQKVIIIKLNGGLGTRMNCDRPKSLIPVRGTLNFLNLTMQQVKKLNIDYDAYVPLVFVNSYNTADETKKMLPVYIASSTRRGLKCTTYTLKQPNRFPRIKADNYDLLCSSYDDENPAFWYPPGDGNFFETFVKSGLLDKFVSEGKEYVFISDIDNLGATVDFKILQLMAMKVNGKLPEFIMEVVKKTPADVKRSTLVQYEGKPKVMEYAQVRDHVGKFKSAGTLSTFNTNNLWVRLDAIKRVVTNNSLSLPVIPNRKQITVGAKKVEIMQLETCAAYAIEAFEGALAVMVPRSRFLPVKTTSDLFLVRSNVFVNNNGHLVMNPERPFNEMPTISLSDEHFGDYRELDRRFEKMPDCLELHHLTVSGDVYFAKDVVLKDSVAVVAHRGERIDIPKGSVLESKILTGSLKIENM